LRQFIGCKLHPFEFFNHRRLVDVYQHGKAPVLKFELDTAYCTYIIYMWCSLGMTGAWQRHKTKHTRLTLKTDTGEYLHFNDPRKFAKLTTLKAQQYEAKVARLGVMPCIDHRGLVSGTGIQKLPPDPRQVKRFANKALCQLLLRQDWYCGIGNYLKCEILYAARLSPYRIVNTLTDYELTSLHRAVFRTCRKFIELGGQTINSYQTPEGKKRLAHGNMKVYRKGWTPVSNIIDYNILRDTNTPDKRVTYWCQALQV